MTQDNIPIAPKESDRKHSIWGIISLDISILFTIIEVLSVILWFNNTIYYIIYPFIYPYRNWLDGRLWWGFPISAVLALLGRSFDRNKIYSIWSFRILGIWLVIAVVVFLYFFISVLRNGVGYY